MRLTVVVLLLALAQLASAGVIYEFYSFRDNQIRTFTMELPDFFPGGVNEVVQYSPGVDNLICSDCYGIWLMHYSGTSWANDEVWYLSPGVTNIFPFPWWSFQAVGTYDSDYDDATLTVRMGEIEQGSGVPEPGTMALVLTGGIAALLWGRRRRVRG